MWQHWLKYRHFRPELQYLLSSPTFHVCQPFPVVIARASSGAAAGCFLLALGCLRWGLPPTAGAAPRARPAKIRRSSSSFPVLQQNLGLSLFGFFFSEVSSCVLSCLPSLQSLQPYKSMALPTQRNTKSCPVLSAGAVRSSERTPCPHGTAGDFPPPGCRRARQLLLQVTRWAGFLSNWPPAEPRLLVLSAVGKI